MSESSDETGPQREGPEKRGRPKKPEEDRRTISHGLYLSKKEKEELERRADAAELSVNEYLRRKALGGTPVAASLDQKTRRELRAIGQRLDRLAEAAGRDDMRALAERLREGVEDLRETLARIE